MNNQEHFLKHDPDGFEKYLTAVESGEKTISSATLLPHELLAHALNLDDPSTGKTKSAAIRDLKRKIALSKIRVVEAQWKTLISNLREAGEIENSAMSPVQYTENTTNAMSLLSYLRSPSLLYWPPLRSRLLMADSKHSLRILGLTPMSPSLNRLRRWLVLIGD